MKQNDTRFHALRIRAAELKNQGLPVEEIAERLDIPKMIAMAMLERSKV